MTETDFESLWKNLVQRMHGADEPALSKHERHFYAVNLLRGSVPRSGFIGYFENWSGSEIADAYEGLRALELPSALELLEQAARIVLGGRPVPVDASPIEIFPASLTEAEYEAFPKQVSVEEIQKIINWLKKKSDLSNIMPFTNYYLKADSNDVRIS